MSKDFIDNVQVVEGKAGDCFVFKIYVNLRNDVVFIPSAVERLLSEELRKILKQEVKDYEVCN